MRLATLIVEAKDVEVGDIVTALDGESVASGFVKRIRGGRVRGWTFEGTARYRKAKWDVSGPGDMKVTIIREVE